MSGKHGVLKWVLMFLSTVLSTGYVCGQTSVTATVDTTSRNYVIPPDFAGLGFETASVTSNVDEGGVSGNFWSPSNTELITLFQNMSLKNLRIGGSSVNGSHPTDSDIDALFQWAPLAGVHIIYSVPIYCDESANPPYCPSPSDDAAIAGYISTAGYQSSLDAISIGNEQDWHGFLYGQGGTDPNISNLPTYLTDWQKFASGIDDTVTESYASPDTGSYNSSSYYTGSSCGTSYPNGVSWTQGFADCKATPGGTITSQISSVTQHYYVGACFCWTTGGTKYYLSTDEAIEDMLAPDWLDNSSSTEGPHLATGPYGLEPYTPYLWLYSHNLSPVLSDNLAYRLTESNDFLGGVDGASNAFASALWALDYMHWWAAHGAAGTNFHNTQWLYTDTILPGNLPSNYEQQPGVTFTGGGTCTTICAAASAFVSSAGTGTTVTSVTVNNGGSYTSPPTGVTIDPPPASQCSGACTAATATVQTATIPGSNPTLYEVTGVTVTNGGAGYLPAGCQNSSGAQEACDDWIVNPKGYAIKAFDLGGHGYAESVSLDDTLSNQVAAYSVGSGLTSYLTFINKTNNVRGNSTTISLTIEPTGFNTASGAYMTLTSGTAGDPTPQAATLAGQTINNNSPWLGRWTALAPDTSGSLTLSVPATEAVVVRIDAAGELSGPIQMNQDGALEMFAVGSGGVQHDYQKEADVPQSPAADWSGWSTVSSVASVGGSAVVKNEDNTLQVFVPTSGDVYWTQQPTPGGGPWPAWTDMTSSSGLGLTNLAAGNNPDGSLSVFGLNSSGVLYTISENAPEIGWASSWTALNTGSGDPTIMPGYVVTRNLDGRLELFGADSSGNVWHCWEKTTASGWSSWQELSGEQLNSQLAVARNLGGELQVFGVDSSGNVWTISQTSAGGSWGTSWTEIAGETLKPGIVVGQNQDGRLVLFGVSTQSPNDVWNIWQQGSAGGSFGGNWTDMGGSGLDPHLVASSTQDERIQLFTVDSTGVVWSDWQPSTGGWNGWTSFGGSGLAFYPGQP